MKRMYILLLSLSAVALAQAQAPQQFNYQAVARDITGNVLPNHGIVLRTSILNAGPSGTKLYQETFALTTNSFGLLSVAIGSGTPVSGNFSTIDWATSGKYLAAEIDFKDGKGFQLMGTSQLLSVPFALYAQNSGSNNAWQASASNIFNGNTGNVGIGTNMPLARLHVTDSNVLFTGGTGLLTTNPGNTPMSGIIGIRTFWYPDKGAFRTGGIDNGLTFIPNSPEFDFFGGLDNWDKDNVGVFSFASGYNTMAKGLGATATGVCTEATGDMSFAGGFHSSASGTASYAMGINCIATGRSFAQGGGSLASSASVVMGSQDTATLSSFAFGDHSVAGGGVSFAMGQSATASGIHSVAIGTNVTASGRSSIVLGSDMDAGGKNGVFLIGDASGKHNDVPILPTDNNEFTAFFQNGYRLFTNTDENGIPTGVILNSEDNAWSSISDSTKKTHFLTLDGEQLLQKIGGFNSLGSWSYKGQDPKTHRHYGPMAQDFHHAFGNDGIGKSGNDTLINSADMSGILFIAVHALAGRTNEMNKKASLQECTIGRLEAANIQQEETNSQLKEENKAIRELYAHSNEALNNKLALLEAQLNRLSAQMTATNTGNSMAAATRTIKNK